MRSIVLPRQGAGPTLLSVAASEGLGQLYHSHDIQASSSAKWYGDEEGEGICHLSTPRQTDKRWGQFSLAHHSWIWLIWAPDNRASSTVIPLQDTLLSATVSEEWGQLSTALGARQQPSPGKTVWPLALIQAMDIDTVATDPHLALSGSRD